MFNDLVIENIKKIRKKYNLTQKEFAKRLSVSRSAIALIESDRNYPSEQLIKNIELEFGIRHEWLITGKGAMKKSGEEIIDEAVELISDDIDEVEKGFLYLMERKLDEDDKEKANFYRLINQLIKAYNEGDRDTQGYITIQLKKSFPEYLDK